MAELQPAAPRSAVTPESAASTRDLGADAPGNVLPAPAQRIVEAGRVDRRWLTPHTLLALQRTVGNRSTSRLLQRASVIDVNGVGHSEDDSAIKADANGVLHDAAGKVVTFRAPDGVFVEQASGPGGDNQSPASAPTQKYTVISRDPPMVLITGPLSDATIGQDLYGDPAAAVEHLSNFSCIKVRVDALVPAYKSLFAPGASTAGAAGDQSPSIAQLSTADKLMQAIKRAPIGGEFKSRIDELLTPQSLATMAGFTAVFIAAQLTPAGWVADIIGAGLVLVSAILIGPEVVQVVQHFANFVTIASNANSDGDLDRAGQEFAVATTKVSVDVAMAILMHRVVKAAGPTAEPPVTQKFGAMVTPDGQVTLVPFEEIPENASAMKGEGERPGAPKAEPRVGLDQDPQTGQVNAKSQSEAASVLEAEKQGLVKNARRPVLAKGEPNLDFVVDGGYADIKTPVDPAVRPLPKQAADMAPKIASYDPNVTVLIDLKNLSPAQKVQFQTELGNRGGITAMVRFLNL